MAKTNPSKHNRGLLSVGIGHLEKIAQRVTLDEAEAYVESIEADMQALADALTDRTAERDSVTLSALFNVYKLMQAVSALEDDRQFAVHKASVNHKLQELKAES